MLGGIPKNSAVAPRHAGGRDELPRATREQLSPALEYVQNSVMVYPIAASLSEHANCERGGFLPMLGRHPSDQKIGQCFGSGGGTPGQANSEREHTK
jgi:hypothetical protein